MNEARNFAAFPAGRGNVRGARMIQPTRSLPAFAIDLDRSAAGRR
jgi:hypothetical protein